MTVQAHTEGLAHSGLIERLEEAEAGSRALDRAIWTALEFDSRGEPSRCPTYTTSPDAAPALADDGQFLLDRLAEFENRISTDEDAREFHGHVAPAIARFRAAILTAKGQSQGGGE